MKVNLARKIMVRDPVKPHEPPKEVIVTHIASAETASCYSLAPAKLAVTKPK